MGLVELEQDLAQAQDMIDEGCVGEAIQLIQTILMRAEDISGEGKSQLLSRTYGALGIALIRAGCVEEATNATERARAICEQSGDSDGVATYAGNLKYIEDGTRIVFSDREGRSLTLHDLAGLTGEVNYEIVGPENIPAEAQELHEKGRQAGSAGDYATALAEFARATKLAPEWPYPVYDMGFTYLLMKDFEKALACYRKTVELAPRGFFTAITAVDALERESRGELPAGIYFEYSSTEWIEDPAEKVKAVGELTRRAPNFAPAWKDLMTFLPDDEAKRAAVEKGLAADPDLETGGVLAINKALILSRTGGRDDAIQMLGKLAVDPASTLGTEYLAKAILGQMLEPLEGLSG